MSILSAAEQTGRVLVVELLNGDKEYFALNEDPHITFSNRILYVKTTRQDYNSEISSVRNYHFEDVPTDIHGVDAGDGFRIQSISDNKIRISNFGDNAIRVYGTSGRQVSAGVSINGDSAEISLRSLPAGIYVIKAGKNTIKVEKK